MNILVGLLTFLLVAVECIFAIYLILPGVILSIAGFFKPRDVVKMRKTGNENDKDFDFAAIITAHQDTRFILPFVDSFLKQTYQNFVVYIIADDCDISSFEFDDKRIKLIRPDQALHSKVKSINYAIDHFEREHDAFVIFDSDCLVHPQYFEKLNVYYQAGYSVVQTIMLSKNSDTVFAKVDSIGWVFNTFVERDARMKFGLSSSISGNGIAIKTKLYAEVMYQDSLGGFDKRLQAYLVKKVDTIAFANDVIVYDEKVNDGKSFETQRTRWLYSYFKYFNDSWKLFLYGLKTLSFNKAFFGFSSMRPPLFITIGISMMLLLINLFINPIKSLIWGILILVFVGSFIVIALTQGYQKGMGSAILHLPNVVFIQIRAFLQMGKAGKSFLKTEHKEILYIEDIMK
jgi:cellulose synthase/poly-beta-1,6-N-acetylglucosamine synthase-like glycosyltransferase